MGRGNPISVLEAFYEFLISATVLPMLISGVNLQITDPPKMIPGSLGLHDDVCPSMFAT